MDHAQSRPDLWAPQAEGKCKVNTEEPGWAQHALNERLSQSAQFYAVGFLPRQHRNEQQPSRPVHAGRFFFGRTPLLGVGGAVWPHALKRRAAWSKRPQ